MKLLPQRYSSLSNPHISFGLTLTESKFSVSQNKTILKSVGMKNERTENFKNSFSKLYHENDDLGELEFLNLKKYYNINYK